MLNCKDVAHLVASDEFATAGPFMKFRVRMHLFMCRSCRRYVQQLRIIGEAAKEKWHKLVPSQDVINRLENSILEDALGNKPDR